MTILADLPDELLMRIVEYLDIAATRAFATVDSRFHGLLVPTLFEGVRATNREDDAEILQEITLKYSRHVNKLYFDLCLLGNSPGDHDHGDPIDPGEQGQYTCDKDDEDDCRLPETARKMLDGELLPNLTSLQLSFDFDFDSDINDLDGDGESHYDYGEPGLFGIFELPETEADFAEKEHEFHWRMTLRDVISALGGNQVVKRLQMRNLVPKGTSAYLTTEWKVFLAGLEVLDIELWGGGDMSEWSASTAPGYCDFIRCLNSSFFAHLSSATSLRFAASPHCPIGGLGHIHTPLPISPPNLPRMQNLAFENIFLDTALVNLLHDHSQNLQSLAFKNCLSLGRKPDYSISSDRVSWADLFITIRTSKPILRKLTVEDEPHALRLAEGYDVWGCEVGKESEKVKGVEGEVERGERKVFLYGGFDEKYGYVVGRGELNLECFQEGADQREWDAVREVVEGNRGRVEVGG